MLSRPSVIYSYEALATLVAGAAMVALLCIPEVPRPLAPLGLLVGLIYYLIFARRELHRRRVLRRPFPGPWREVLVRRVPYYRQLAGPEAARFEQEVQVFLAEQRIYPIQGAELWQRSPYRLTDEHRVLIAASAAMLLLGRPEWRLPTVRDIVVYPSSFVEETYEITEYGHTHGMVHAQGPILISLPALLRAYPEWAQDSLPEGVPNVALHEFAHVLDFMGGGGQAGGVPALVAPGLRERWYRQLQIEHERLAAGHSVLHPYAMKNDAELFAVAVESFFMDPLRLRTLHAALYDLLSELFNQDPATRLLPHHAHWLLKPWFAAPVRYVA